MRERGGHRAEGRGEEGKIRRGLLMEVKRRRGRKKMEIRKEKTMKERGRRWRRGVEGKER